MASDAMSKKIMEDLSKEVALARAKAKKALKQEAEKRKKEQEAAAPKAKEEEAKKKKEKDAKQKAEEGAKKKTEAVKGKGKRPAAESSIFIKHQPAKAAASPEDDPLPKDVYIESDDDDSMDLDLPEPFRPVGPLVEATAYAGPYKSRFLDLNPSLRLLLEHVNCSYLSTRGRAPSLYDLKSHTQALTTLIKHLTASTSGAAIDGTNPSGQNEAFDFLLDLTKHYTNKSEPHTLALTSVLNTAENMGLATASGYRDRCPLQSADVTDQDEANAHPIPYATQQALISHANDVLERLDHEFAAEGGIMGMLPLNELGYADDAPNTIGRQSILGQWIAYTRSLACRVHELEMNLKETLDIIGGEAIIPRERLSQAPIHTHSDGYAGLQDKFLLALESDMWTRFSTEFARREDISPKSEIVSLEVVTKYSRLRGGRTIFITPSLIAPPRKEPGVVQVVKAEWRDRSSAWEQKFGQELQQARSYRPENEELKREVEMLREATEALWVEREQWKFSHPDEAFGVVEEGEKILRGKDLVDLKKRERDLETRMSTFGDAVKDQMRILQERTDAAERYFAGGGAEGVPKPVWI